MVIKQGRQSPIMLLINHRLEQEHKHHLLMPSAEPYGGTEPGSQISFDSLINVTGSRNTRGKRRQGTNVLAAPRGNSYLSAGQV